MSESEDLTDEWMEAGRSAPLTNSPMGERRFEELALAAAHNARGAVVDFGCGFGAFARRVAELNPAVRVVGLDTDTGAIADAHSKADQAGLADRVTFTCADVTSWDHDVDTAVCIGSSHAFGSTSKMLQQLHDFGARLAVIGDAFWQSEPDDWHLAEFGELPDGLDAVAELAKAAGWTVEHVDASTLDEWDTFEEQWRAGVRALGTPGAIAFAEQREAEYLKYRGVLGFAWLQLAPS